MQTKHATDEAESDVLWQKAVKVLQEFQAAIKRLKAINDPVSPEGLQALRELVFDASRPLELSVQADFKVWFRLAFGRQADMDLSREKPWYKGPVAIILGDTLTQEDANATSEAYVDYLYALDKYQGEVQRYLSQVAPTSFSYEGFRVLNPNRIGEARAMKMLAGISWLVSLFKEKGMLEILRNSAAHLLLNGDIGGNNWHGYCSYQSKLIALSTKMLDKDGGRLWKDWVQEVFLHEVGHSVHTRFITKDAKDFWDGTWKPVQEARDVLTKVTQADMARFYVRLEKNAFNPMATAKGLKAADKVKFAYWLRHPAIGEPLITPNQFRPTKKGQFVFNCLRDPVAYAKEQGREWDMDAADWKTDAVAKVIRARKDTMGFDMGDLPIDDKELTELREADPSIDQSIEDLYQELGVPSEYGKTDKYEDFAECFVLFMAAPEELSANALYRMKRTLWLSGYGGKPVMRLAQRVVERHLRSSRRAPASHQ